MKNETIKHAQKGAYEIINTAGNVNPVKVSFEKVSFNETYGDASTSYISILAAKEVTMKEMTFENKMGANNKFTTLNLETYGSPNKEISVADRPFNPGALAVRYPAAGLPLTSDFDYYIIGKDKDKIFNGALCDN